nr:MAG TPA: hypothetical protein [Caudoviricetes sp.]
MQHDLQPLFSTNSCCISCCIYTQNTYFYR